MSKVNGSQAAKALCPDDSMAQIELHSSILYDYCQQQLISTMIQKVVLCLPYTCVTTSLPKRYPAPLGLTPQPCVSTEKGTVLELQKKILHVHSRHILVNLVSYLRMCTQVFLQYIT